MVDARTRLLERLTQLLACLLVALAALALLEVTTISQFNPDRLRLGPAVAATLFAIVAIIGPAVVFSRWQSAQSARKTEGDATRRRRRQ